MKKTMKILLSAFVFMLIIISCSNGKKADSQSPDMGKYVFEDDNGILHVDENCFKLRHGHDDNGHEIYAKIPIDTTEIVIIGRICSRCVSIENFEHLQIIAQRNKLRDKDRKWLYDKMVETYSGMPSYEEFLNELVDTRTRKKIYDTAISEGWNVGKDFLEFSNLVGF